MVKSKKILPNLKDLELVRGEIKKIPNKKGEYLRKVHYGCYLLCSESGLRISEAVGFDLNAKTRKGLYRIEKPKGKKERLIYVPKEVIQELKQNNWQPHQTNRFNFYHFLRKIKQEINISPKTELTPHNLRRAFATYQAESGMPLPVLQKLLGHSSIRTTALYWKDIYSDDNDPNNILAGKKWLEGKEPPKTPPTIEEKLPIQPLRNSEPSIIKNKPVIAAKKPDNSLLKSGKGNNSTITNYQPQKLISEISSKTPEKFSLNTNEQLPLITNGEQPTNKEQILLIKIKQLEKELVKVKAENEKLRVENKHLKALINQDQETETKILQPLPLKGK